MFNCKILHSSPCHQIRINLFLSIGTSSGYTKITSGDGTNGSGLQFGDSKIYPVEANSVVTDNAVDFGDSNYRFKDLYLSGGVYLGGTGAANKLDDYEEGTFTATLTSVTPPTVPPTATCYYTKVGNLVNAFIRFTNVNTTGGAGTMTITGLPFTAGGPAANNASCPMTYGLSSPGTYVSAYVNAGTSVVSFLANNDNANWLTVSITAGSAKYLTLNVTYHTA